MSDSETRPPDEATQRTPLDPATAARIERLSTLARALRRELVGLQDEEAVYACACRIATGVGRFRFAWIGLPDQDSGIVRPVAHSGDGASYLDQIVITIDRSAESRGPTASALREGVTIVSADIARDPRMEPWRVAAARHGFLSSGAFPFRRGGRPAGTLNVYADEPGFADPLEQFMLEGIAEDIGLALDGIDERAARERAEHQLAESEARYRAFFERASDAIFVADPQHRYVEVNPAGCRLLGYARDELVGLHLRDVIPPEDLVTQPIATERYDANAPFVVERRLLRRDGGIVEVEISGIKFSDGSLQSVVRDISERKRLLAERAATERITSLGRLAQGVGHEINNPLAYLVLSIDHLRLLVAESGASTNPSSIEITSALDTIAEAAARITSIVKSLSSFGRGDGETIGPVSIARAVQAAVAISANRVNHVARVEAQLEALPDVRANEFQLTQVFVNLLLNAADAIAEAAPGPHEIRVAAHVERDLVVIEVSDTGPGIAPQLRQRLFEPYVTTKSIGRGTGLGLSICRSIVESFSGRIELVDPDGRGATFRITLPIAQGLDAMHPERPEPRSGPTQPLRLLVVDDEPLLLESLRRGLRAHELTTTPDTSSALTLCRAHDYDRILCDLMFPGGSAEPFYDALCAEAPELARRVVFMTGGAFTESARRFLERTGRPWLAKPFTSAQLDALLMAPAPG